MNTPKSAPSIAASKSASAKKMLGDFPPSSSVTRFTVSAASFTIILPTAAEPVKAILLTSGCLTSGEPQLSPKPVTIFTTPFGKPFCEFKRGQRRLLGRFQNTGATRGQRRRQLPGGHH